MSSRLSIISTLVLVGTWNGGCEKSSPNYSIIQPVATAEWGRALCEGLHIRNAIDGTGDLLLMSPSTSADTREGIGLPAMRNLSVYRYSKSRGLFVVAPEAWEETDAAVVECNKQRSLLYTGTLMHDLFKHTIQFHGREVMTAAPTVLDTAVSPNREYAAVISAEGKSRRGGMMPFGDPIITGKRFHQVFRMSDATPVGDSVILKGTSERNDVRPCWSPDGRYVVYKDGKCENLWIIEVPGAGMEDDEK